MDGKVVKGVVLASIVFLAVISNRISRTFYIPKWKIALTLIVIGVILYVLMVSLIRRLVGPMGSFGIWMPNFEKPFTALNLEAILISIIGLVALVFIITGILPLVIPFILYGLSLVLSLFQ